MTAFSPGEPIGMNKRKSLLVISLEPTLCDLLDVPPFAKVDNAVIVCVDVGEEAIKTRVGYGEASADKGGA